MEIRRRDRFLSEELELLNARYEECGGDSAFAYSKLSKFEVNFIDEEINRCFDFRYYAENYHAINSKREGIKTLYPFFDSQEIFYTKICELQRLGQPIQVIVLKARQLGLSTINEALIFHRTIFTEGCNTLIVAQDPGQADYLFNMTRLAYDCLPWWMRPEARYEQNARYLGFDRRDEHMRITRPGLRSAVFVEAANKMTGVAVGKGLTALHMSELSLWPDAKVLAEQIFPTLSKTPNQIAVMESTARGRNNFWHELWKDAQDGKIPWIPVFIEFFRLKQYSTVIPVGMTFERTKEEIALAEKVKENSNFTLTDEQLYWRRTEMQTFATLNRGDESKFYQEYPGASSYEAFQGSGVCAFNKKKLQLILESTCCPPKYYGEIDLKKDKSDRWYPEVRIKEAKKGENIPAAEGYGARLLVWEAPKEGERYYIAGDVAHGVYGGDYSCAQVIRIGHGVHPDEQVAEWHGWINPTPYGDVLCALGYWYNSAEIAIECNDVGQATNARVMRVLEYPNLFRWKHYDKIKNFITDFMGWYTNVKTRDLIIAKFREYIDDGMVVIRSEKLIDECFDFSSVDDSRFEGQSTHDDRVFAMMIAIFCSHDSEGWGTDQAAPAINKQDLEIFCLCGHTKDRHGDRHNKTANCQDCGCPIWRQRGDFANTDFSPIFDRNSRPTHHPNEDPPPSDYLLWDEMGSEQVEKWKTL